MQVRIVDPGGFYDRMEGKVVGRRQFEGAGGSYPVVRFAWGDEQVFTDDVLEEIE